MTLFSTLKIFLSGKIKFWKAPSKQFLKISEVSRQISQSELSSSFVFAVHSNCTHDSETYDFTKLCRVVFRTQSNIRALDTKGGREAPAQGKISTSSDVTGHAAIYKKKSSFLSFHSLLLSVNNTEEVKE